MVTHPSTNLYLCCLTSNILHSIILPLSYWHSSKSKVLEPCWYSDSHCKNQIFLVVKRKDLFGKKWKQAGAELCQAQGELNLFLPWWDPCLLWLTNMVLICQLGLWISKKFSLKCSVWKGFIPHFKWKPPSEKQHIGSEKIFGSKRHFVSIKILGSNKIVSIKKI